MSIREKMAELPDLLTTEELVRIGVYRSRSAAHSARYRPHGAPECVRVGKRVLYPKEKVISYLEGRDFGKKTNPMVPLNLILPYLKVPCPGCSFDGAPIFTQFLTTSILNDPLPFSCPKCDLLFELRNHPELWRAYHKGPLNGDSVVIASK